jgi:hypothetical protein
MTEMTEVAEVDEVAEIATPTAEEIARHYSAAMDSVNLINGSKPDGISDEDWADCLTRNKEHLNIMLAKDFWTTEDLEPLQQAAA